MIELKQLAGIWHRIWFSPVSPAPFCLFRICFGAIAALTAGEWLLSSHDLFAAGAMTSMSTVRSMYPDKLTVFWWLYPSAQVVNCLLLLLFLSALSLMLGFKTRLSAFLVWFLLVSFSNRNPLILNCGDDFIRIAALLVFLGPAGKMYALDRLFALSKQPSSAQTVLCPPWAQRLLQLQTGLIYAWSFLYKYGESWWNGTAIYYAMHVKSYAPFINADLFDNLWAGRLLCFLTLALEFSLFTLIWVKELRPWVLLAGLLLHVSLLLTMSFPFLQLIMIASYLNFVEPETIQAIISAFGRVLLPPRKGVFAGAVEGKSGASSPTE